MVGTRNPAFLFAVYLGKIGSVNIGRSYHMKEEIRELFENGLYRTKRSNT